MRSGNVGLLCSSCVLLIACGTQPVKPSGKHIQSENADAARSAGIPQPIKRAVPLSPPIAAPKAETYSVVVTNVAAQEILFALARDAKINLDIHAGIQGAVTLNAIDQTLPQILNRIAKQVDMRYELDGPNLVVMPDSPFLKHYKIDYVNMARDSDSAISDSTQVGSGAAGGASGGSTGNNSSLAIKNISRNHFWETLTQNIKDILRETDKVLPSGSSETLVQQSSAISTTGTGAQQAAGGKKSTAKSPGIENSPNPATVQEGGTTVTRTSTFREAASVIANPESGIVTVRATAKQHDKIQEFIDQIMASVRRQVLIEATVVEVRLSDQYQQGINWYRLLQSGSTKGFSIGQAGTPVLPNSAAATAGTFILNYVNPTSKLGSLSASVSLLESFGTVKVLSSPKLSVINNQTAMLRVVDNLVYFTIKADTVTSQNGPAVTTYTTTPNTVPVGFTMSVTPQINDSDTVLLNLRPSISRLLSYVDDPNPSLAGIKSRIPQTQTREMESVLKIESNQIAVLGGLMEDRIDNSTDAIPGAASIPLFGNLFKNRDDTTTKTELVIFLRPVVIKDASISGDYSAYRDSLPNEDFFKESGKRTGNSIKP
ncbi:MAG: pilus (MSHA type) biogenesis protein MshL [Nitrosomonadales bacterium]|nr:pilus (MSHA type) biogenesis protein MshL [Nitrosomonadales bacterium]